MALLDALWQYQQADAQVDKLEASIQSTDEYARYAKLHKFIAQQRRILGRMSKAIEARKEQLDKAKKHVSLLEQRYGDGLEKYERVDKSNIEEVERFRQYFEQINARLNQQKRESSELILDSEKDEGLLEEMRLRLARANKEYEEAKEAVAQIKAGHKDEIDAAKAEVKRLAQKTDPELLQRYKQIKKSQSMPVAMVVDDRCGGCNMVLPAVTLNKLREGDEIVECESCGRLLRREEE